MSNQSNRPKADHKHIEAKWDQFSDVYERTCGYTSYHASMALLPLLDLHNRQNILEISCGGGSLTCEVATKKPKSGHLTSQDLSTEMLSITQTKLNHLESNHANYQESLNQIQSSKENLSKSKSMVSQKYTEPINFEKLNVHLRHDNAEDLSFAKENTFDALYSPLCFHLVQNFEVAIYEAYRVLKPGCPMAFTVWGTKADSKFFTICQDVMIAEGALDEDVPQNRSPFHLNNPELVIPALEKAGFRDCRSFETFTPMYFNDWKGIGEEYTKAMFNLMSGMQEPWLTKVWEASEKHVKTGKKPLGFSLMFYYGYK